MNTRFRTDDGMNIALRRRYRDVDGILWDEWDTDDGDLFVTLTSDTVPAHWHRIKESE